MNIWNGSHLHCYFCLKLWDEILIFTEYIGLSLSFLLIISKNCWLGVNIQWLFWTIHYFSDISSTLFASSFFCFSFFFLVVVWLHFRTTNKSQKDWSPVMILFGKNSLWNNWNMKKQQHWRRGYLKCEKIQQSWFHRILISLWRKPIRWPLKSDCIYNSYAELLYF